MFSVLFIFYHFFRIFLEIHAYDNTAFNPGAHEMEERRDRDSKVEVERLGYEMYNGKHENRWAKIVMIWLVLFFFGYYSEYKKRIHPKFPDFTHTSA